MLFSDLVAFIEKQVRISDPLCGNIQDLPSTKYKASNSGHLKQRKKGRSFATNVIAVKEGVITLYTGNKTKSFSTHNCLFCSHSSHSLDKCSQSKAKVLRNKIHFIKEKGIWNPEVLHIERQDKGTFSSQSKPSLSPPSNPTATTVSQTCGHIGAGCEDDSIFSIVAVKVKSQRSNKTVQTYALLDPGSSGTFCTKDLARKLNLKGKRTSILLRTMGQMLMFCQVLK